MLDIIRFITIIENYEKLNSFFRNGVKRKNGSSEKIKIRDVLGKRLMDFAMEDLSGRIWHLNKTDSILKVIIIFSVEDCPICLQEYPLWKKIYENYKNELIYIIGIAHNSDLQRLVSFVEDKDIQFPILYDSRDIVRNSLCLNTSPWRLLLDRNNRIIEIDQPAPQLSKQKETLNKIMHLLK